MCFRSCWKFKNFNIWVVFIEYAYFLLHFCTIHAISNTLFWVRPLYFLALQFVARVCRALTQHLCYLRLVQAHSQSCSKGGSKIKGGASRPRKFLLINYSWRVWSMMRHNYSAFVYNQAIKSLGTERSSDQGRFSPIKILDPGRKRFYRRHVCPL